MSDVCLTLQDISKSFDKLKVINHFSMELKKHEIVCIMGPSGVGKTTLLRCITGLETIDEGTIQVEGQNEISASKIGLVFQNYALFPHHNVLRNCIDAVTYHKLMSKDEAIKKAKDLLDKMGIADKVNSYPSQLSGGQKQKVALIRASMLNPVVMCFDEPTSALDEQSVNEVIKMIQNLSQQDMGILIVTHDPSFAQKVSTRIVRLS